MKEEVQVWQFNHESWRKVLIGRSVWYLQHLPTMEMCNFFLPNNETTPESGSKRKVYLPPIILYSKELLSPCFCPFHFSLPIAVFCVHFCNNDDKSMQMRRMFTFGANAISPWCNFPWKIFNKQPHMIFPKVKKLFCVTFWFFFKWFIDFVSKFPD